MSKFEVPVVRVTKVEHHPNADRLSLIYFRGYTTISAKLDDGSHRYKEGDLVVYVPEQAIVPEYLLRQGFWNEVKNHGLLHGSGKNRVKAIRLRGVVSQGIMFPTVNDDLPVAGHRECLVVNQDGTGLYACEDDDVAAHLGIVKFEPHMTASWSRIIAGNVFYLGTENTINFDIESLQKYPHVMNDPDEIVAVTEKLHGTFCQLAYLPGHTDHVGFLDQPLFVGSKGQSAKGLMFKNDDTSLNNVYVNTVVRGGIAERFVATCSFFDPHATAKMYLCGEIYGQGVQDLGYGESGPTFRAFGIFRGNPRDGSGRWLDREEFDLFTTRAEIPTAPLLFLGPWKDIEPNLNSLRDGKTTLAGQHIREGVVIIPAVERHHHRFGRVILKVVSPDYLMRKGAVTEFA